MSILQGFLGVAVFLSIAFYLSEDKESVSKRSVIQGFFILFLFALFIFEFPYIKSLFTLLNHVADGIQQATQQGAQFVFGYLGSGDIPFVEKEGGNTYILFFQTLPIIIVISALSSLLFYWRILPYIIGLLSTVFNKLFGMRGPVGIGSASNLFLGMDTAPLLIKPHLMHFTKSELFVLMTAGMATVSSSVILLYAGILKPVIDHPLGHIISALLLNVAAAIIIARIMVPETEEVYPDAYKDSYSEAENAMDAIAIGVKQGVKVLINVAGMLIAVLSIIALINIALGAIPWFSTHDITIQKILGYIMAPVAWLMGIPYEDIHITGSLLATKIVFNEVIAYLDLAQLDPNLLDMRSKIIMVYSLCGFANFASIGILVGSLSSLIPERRAEIARLGYKSMIAGTLATLITGTIAGIFIA